MSRTLTATATHKIISPTSLTEVKRRFLWEMRAGESLSAYRLKLELSEDKLNQYGFFEGVTPFGTIDRNFPDIKEVWLSVICPPEGAPMVFFIGYDDIEDGLYPEKRKE